LVQKALIRAGVANAAPTTLVGAIDIVADFKEWTQDSWRELQEESTNWWFRTKEDQTLSVLASTDAYAMPTNLETLNYRTGTIYTTAKQDETPVDFMDYEHWRVLKDTVASQESRPTHITETPGGQIVFWPVPDQAYTFRYDGVYDLDEMTVDADTPGLNIAGAQTLDSRYHYYLVWDTVARYAEQHQDQAAFDRAQKKAMAQHRRIKNKRTPSVWIPPGRLTGHSRSYRSVGR
jgi:hypothetical protein